MLSIYVMGMDLGYHNGHGKALDLGADFGLSVLQSLWVIAIQGYV